MNEEQKALILEAMSITTPDLFSISVDDFAWKAKVGDPIASFEKRILEKFSKKEGAEIFAKLGGKEPMVISKDNANKMKMMLSHAKPSDDCQCSRDHDWCWPTDCVGNICNVTQSGCGAFYLYPCNGTKCFELN